MDYAMMLEDYLADRVYQIQSLLPGDVCGMPNGSEVEVVVSDGMTYFLHTDRAAATLIPYGNADEQYRAAMGLAQAGLQGEFRSEYA